jgi:Mg2+-importing ATPase
MTVRAAPA